MSDNKKVAPETIPLNAATSVRKTSIPLILDRLFPLATVSLLVGTVVGTLAGIYISHPLSWIVPGVAAGILLIRSLYPMFLKKPTVRKGRFTALYDGDFVVFLIGIRPNFDFKFTQNFVDAGNAMVEIDKELKENPDLGCLGSETYIGAHTDGSVTLSVQYWRSAQDLEKYAQNRQNRHYDPWRKLMKLGKNSAELGFWHETFLVKKGEYEAIYVNCPPFGFANARGVRVEPALYNLSTMKARLGKGTGDASEWPEGFTQERDA